MPGIDKSAGVRPAYDRPRRAARPRKTSVQPGQLEFGFYARAYKAGELADLDIMLAEGLQDEIAMLRVAIRRVIEFVSDFETPNEAAATLGALGLAATRLATLLRTQKLLDGGEHNTAAALSQTLGEVVKELGIHA